MRDIYIKDPDGEPEYDGEEETKSLKINNHGIKQLRGTSSRKP